MNEIWYKVHRIFSTYLLSGIYTEPKDSYDFTNEVEYGTQHGGLDEVLIAWDFTTGQKLHTICYSDPKDRKIIKDASFTVRVCWPLVAVFRSVDAFKGEVFSKKLVKSYFCLFLAIFLFLKENRGYPIQASLCGFFVLWNIFIGILAKLDNSKSFCVLAPFGLHKGPKAQIFCC